MAIIEEHKLIFYHIPKTGGTSICNFFGVDTSGHNHYNHYADVLLSRGKQIEDYKKFTVVRHPVTRFLSACKQYTTSQEKYFSERNEYLRKEFFQDFEGDVNEFVMYFADSASTDTPGKNMLLAIPHFWPQFAFLGYKSDDENELRGVPMDYVLCQEHLEEDLHNMLQLENIKIDNDLLHFRKTWKPGWAVENLTAKSIAIIEGVYELDFQMLEQIFNNGLRPISSGDK